MFTLRADNPSTRPRLLVSRIPTRPWIFVNEVANLRELVDLQRSQQEADTQQQATSISGRNKQIALSPLLVSVCLKDTLESVGVALFHSRPQIAARLLQASSDETIDAKWISRILTAAASRRKGLPSSVLRPPLRRGREAAEQKELQDTPSEASDVKAWLSPQSSFSPETQKVPAGFYRLLHGEADGLPGVYIDLFQSAVSVQLLTRGRSEAIHTLSALGVCSLVLTSARRRWSGCKSELRVDVLTHEWSSHLVSSQAASYSLR